MYAEIWSDIKDYEGLYEINNLGYVRRKDTKRDLNAWHNYKGYMKVALSKNGEKHEKFIHRLVAEAFINNPLNLPQVNHINGNKDNNAFYNLEWCTCKENIKHSYDNNLIDATARANNRKDNHHITLDGKTQTISQWSKELQIDRSKIYRRIKKGLSPKEILDV